MLATLKEWIGKVTKENETLGAQCVAWAKKFAEEQGHPIGTFSGSALNGWLTGSPFIGTKWERVTNTTTAIPKEGAIVFLDKTASNPYGHVAIAGEGCTGSKLVLIEQNAGTGNGDGKNGNKITMRTIKYNDPKRGKCLGWYEYVGKPTPAPTPTPAPEKPLTLKEIYEREKPEGYVPLFANHDDTTPATRGEVAIYGELAMIRAEKIKNQA